MPVPHAQLTRNVPVRDLLIAASLFLLACWQFLGAVDDQPMHRDEARWIHRAEYVPELAHPWSDYWDEDVWIGKGGTRDEQYRLRAQPPLGSYLMGIGLLLQGRDLDTNGFWNMDRDDAWNIARGNQPDPADVTAARRATAVVGALTVVAVYVIVTRLTNRAGGVIGGVFLTFHPLMVLLATFAGSDALLTLMVALAALAACWLADRPTWPRALLLGVFIGLGASTKLSPLAVAVPLALLGGLAVISGAFLAKRGSSGGNLRLGLYLLSVPATAVATLVASYPYLWRDPIDHMRALVDYRQWGMDVQSAAWPHLSVETRIEAFRRVGLKLGDDWTTLGRLSAAMRDHLGLAWNAGALELALAAAGGVMLLALVMKHGPWSAHGLAAAVLAGQVAVTIYGLRVDWARYHLPILLAVAVSAGVLAGQVWTGLLRLPALRATLSTHSIRPAASEQGASTGMTAD
jgi:hypothetical protein